MTEEREEQCTRQTRRSFIQSTVNTAAVVASTQLLPATVGAQPAGASVAIVAGDEVQGKPPVRWAIEQLQTRLEARGISAEIHTSLTQAPSNAVTILVAGHRSQGARAVLDGAGLSVPTTPEALGLVRGRAGDRTVLLAAGADVRGIVYAVLELADRVHHGPEPLAELQRADRVIEQPANRIRAIARLFTSDVEDKAWFYDKSFWQRYLSMLITQRFNRFTMTLGLGYNAPRRVRDSYFYFAYPFLVDVPGYNVKAVGLPDAERERNLAMLRYISEQATARGLHFQLALWTHAYQFRNSPDVNYPIEGLTPENHAAYCQEALARLLVACPAIDGVTFRCHSESGIPEGSYEFWRTIFYGVVRAGPRRPIDIHSKGIDHKLLDIALETGMPVTVSPKYWAEHMGLPYHQASIRSLEFARPSAGARASLERQRRFTRYGYADYLRDDRKYGVLYRIWPGTQRLLLWGDPNMISGYGRFAHFCGSDGLELCEPLSFKGRMGSGIVGSRDGYADASLRPAGGAWEKFLYTYRLWGRLLYNPDAPRETWGRYLTSTFGPAANDCEVALGRASRVLPLITTAYDPSASNNAYWPEINTNMPIVGNQRSPYGDTPSPKRFGTVSSLDPVLFSRVDDFADELIDGHRTGKHSPLDVAHWLDRLATQAETHLARARGKASGANDASFRRLDIDVSVQIGIGRFFAEKFRAAVAYAVFEKTGDRMALKEALMRYRAARDAWAGMATMTKGVYVDDVSFGLSDQLSGHWADRVAGIDKDLADMEARWSEAIAAAPGPGKGAWARVADQVRWLAERQRSRPRCQHMPPKSFRPGRPVAVELGVEAGYRLATARLHYRHVNQADEYQIVDLSERGGRYGSKIPSAYTDSPYPLMYFFELHDARGDVWLYPGLNVDLSNQPYFVVRRA